MAFVWLMPATTYAQQLPQKMSEITLLKINEPLQFNKELTIELTNFTHKRPYTGGPTKATAYLTVTQGKHREEVLLSEHGIQGKTPQNDGLTEQQRYSTITWQGYRFQLKTFKYDESIGVIITKQ